MRLWDRRPRVFKDKADELIYRSTGLLGQFDLHICCKIILSRKAHNDPLGTLSDGEENAILGRFFQECWRWKVPFDSVKEDLVLYSVTVGRPYESVARMWAKMAQGYLEAALGLSS